MAQDRRGQYPSFGDELTSDVTLRLLSASTPGEALTLHLHSKILTWRSDFFKARLSERWRSSEGWSLGNSGPILVTMTHCEKSLDTYKRCIVLMYVVDVIKPTSFTSVEDALDMLGVATELLFQDCVNACMTFLGAVPWSLENEIAIRSCLASLQLEIPTELAARLFILPGCNATEIMKDVCKDLLVVAKTSSVKVVRNNVVPYVTYIQAVAEFNKMVALDKEWDNILRAIKASHREYRIAFSKRHIVSFKPKILSAIYRLRSASSALMWLLNDLLVLKIGDVQVKQFAEDEALPCMREILEMGSKDITGAFVSVLERILLAFTRKELILATSARVALVKRWLFIPGTEFLTDHATSSMFESFCALLESLPQADQSKIFKIWFEKHLKEGQACPDLNATIEHYCDKLSKAQQWQEMKELQQSSEKENFATLELHTLETSSSKPSDLPGS